MAEMKDTIGYIVGGGLKESFRARLTVPAQEVQEGAFVVIENSGWRYYGLVTDLQLGATDPRFADEQTEARLPGALAQALQGQTLFTNLEILPSLMQNIGPDQASPEYPKWKMENPDDPKPQPVKTVPPHHSPVLMARAEHIAGIFGDPRKGDNFVLGQTREQGHPVCIDLKKMVQRSSGIFGATGTGKSFLTRILLAGLMKHGLASVLVFDMHNEYGPDDTSSDTGQAVPGLKKKFGGQVQLAVLGKKPNFRNTPVDFNLEIAMSDITPADIELLTNELNLKETTPTTLEALYTDFRQDWFKEFRNMKYEALIEDADTHKKVVAPGSVEYWANSAGVNANAAKALHSKLGRLFAKPYILEKPAADPIKKIISSLEQGQHVLLSFGEHESDLDYLMVSNLLTRKIREVWVEKADKFRSEGTGEPRQLVIVLEEAHKLLNREMASQTTFSTIARELRKYYVTLLIIDQRPSQIYDEVMSQLGTRISGWLGDEDDIQAVLSGQAGKDTLRRLLARLQPKEEVLLLGWGVPMPIPIRSRRYDDVFWKELLKKENPSVDEVLRDLGADYKKGKR